MFDLINLNFQVFTTIFRHFGMYWYNYITLFGLPILYNKITYNYGWTKLPIFSIKFVNLYILTFLLLVLVSILAFLIQKFGIKERNTEAVRWKSNWYRLFFYTVPVGLGLCVLISFKLLWYEGEELYPILKAYAKSRFLIFLIVFVLFTIWLDRDPKRNWSIAYLSNSDLPPKSVDDHSQVETYSDGDKTREDVSLILDKVSYTIENTINSVLSQKVIKHDHKEMKTIVKEAFEEYAVSNPVAVKYELDLGTMLPLKAMMKEAMREVVDSHQSQLKNELEHMHELSLRTSKVEVVGPIKSELEDINLVPIENLYGKLFANSQTQLKPLVNDQATVIFYHIFAIETHSKYAVVILTDGTQIRSDKILNVLENLGLLKWMVKVNKFHFINAMHICFMNYIDGNFVRIQDLTVKAIQEKLDKKQVLKISNLGNKIKDKKIKEFLESRIELSYESWNAFVRLE